MKKLLCLTTALVSLLMPVSGVYAASGPDSTVFVAAKSAKATTTKHAVPAAKTKSTTTAPTATVPAPTNDAGIDNSCRTKAPGIFDSVHEYTCAFQLFRAFSMPLADSAKRAEFERQFAPSVWLNSDYLKMDGVSEKDRIRNTFALIRRMRDFTHERFDFVSDAAQKKEQDKQSVHPTIEGGIGAQLTLNNMWEVQKEIWDSFPDKTKVTRQQYIDAQNKFAVIGLGHELMIDAPIRLGPSDGVLKSGDIIVSVETFDADGNKSDKPLAGLTQDAAIKLIKGDVGSNVILHVLRKNSAGKLIPLSFTLTRALVAARAVTVHDIDGIRHIELANFTNDTLLDDFYDAVTGAEKAGMKGIDIDVRGNPGGRLDYVTAMLEMLVPRGLILKQVMRDPGSDNLTQTNTTMSDGYAIIDSKSDSAPDSTKNVQAVERVPYSQDYFQSAVRNPGYVDAHPLLPAISEDMPITVEINVGSYSAAEIFAGALQATHRAVIVGQGSAGKGAIMPELPLPEGGNLAITNGQFFPGGMDTKHKGIIPDKIVENADDYGKTDNQRAAADAALKEMYTHIQTVKGIATERTKVNDKRFEDEMKARDDADKLPLDKLDPSEEM